jgi:acetyl-CoA carboxylase alpha subunit
MSRRQAVVTVGAGRGGVGWPVVDVVMTAGQVPGVQQAEDDHGQDEQGGHAIADAAPFVVPAVAALIGVLEHCGLR